MREERAAMDWRGERLLPLAGVLAVGLWVIGGMILNYAAPDEESAEAVLSSYQENGGQILAGAFLFQLGCLFFLWFLGTLWSRLRWAEGGIGRLAMIAFGAGIATAVFLLALPGPDMAGSINQDDISATTAEALRTVTDAFFIGAQLSAAPLVAAVGLATLLTGALPRWLAWVSFVLALVLLIPPVGWAGMLFGFPIWVLLVSFFLWRAGTATPAIERTAPPPAAA